MTMAVQSELQRLVPVSAEEAIEAQASDYAKQNPFLPDHKNLTRQVCLRQHKPELAAFLVNAAVDAQPKVGGLRVNAMSDAGVARLGLLASPLSGSPRLACAEPAPTRIHCSSCC